MSPVLQPANRSHKPNLVWFFLTILIVTVFLGYGWYTIKSFPKPVDIVKRSNNITHSRSSSKEKREVAKHTTTTEKPALTNNRLPLGELNKDELMDSLSISVSNLKSKSRDALEHNVQLSDELILRDPNLYVAYKSKLLNLLLLELKFQRPVNVDIYEGLYDELLNFRDFNEMEQVGNVTVENPELQGIDKDLIHIPFLRLSAMGDIENLASTAEEYISEFPKSHIGYMYLTEAFWKQEDKASALSVFKKGFGENMSDEAAFEIIRSFESKPAIERLTEMTLLQ